MTVGNLAALRQQNVKRMLAYSSIAHAGYLLAAFAGIGDQSASPPPAFYTAAYAAMNVGIFAVITLVCRIRREALADRRFSRAHLSFAAARRPAHLLPRVAHRHPFHRRILRQVLLLHRRGRWRRDLAGHHRPAQLRIGGGILPSPRAGRCAAPDSRRATSPRPSPRSVAVSCRRSFSQSPPRWSSASFPAQRSTPPNPPRTHSKARQCRSRRQLPPSLIPHLRPLLYNLLNEA